MNIIIGKPFPRHFYIIDWTSTSQHPTKSAIYVHISVGLCSRSWPMNSYWPIYPSRLLRVRSPTSMDSRLPNPQPYRILLPQCTQSSITDVSVGNMDRVRRPEKLSPDWVTIYPHAWSMYQIQGFKLREIMTHMEYIYGFKATYVRICII